MKKHIYTIHKGLGRIRTQLRSHARHAKKAHRTRIDKLKQQWSQRIQSLHDRHHKSLHAVFHHMHAIVAYIEYAMILVTGIFGLIGLQSFASTTQVEEYLQYPFEYISTVECRTKHWDEIDPEDDCIIQMPRIYDLDYASYEDNKDYRQFYTVFWGARYIGDTWIQEGPEAGAHAGLDMATSQGTPLYAIGDSTVIFAGERAGWGRVVISMMEYKGQMYEVIYAHMDEIQVRSGDTIRRGDYIGTVGNTGMTFGALGGFHLHLQINKGDTYSYLGCDADDLSRGHMYIINNGKCRDALRKNTLDPLVLIEGSLSRYEQQYVHKPTHDTGNTDTEQKTEQKIESESSRYTAISVVAGDRYDQITPDLHTSADTTPPLSETNTKVEYSKKATLSQIEPSMLTLTTATRRLLQNYRMETALTYQNDVHMLHIQFIHRSTNKPYVGILPVALQLIASDSGTHIGDNYISSISREGVYVPIQLGKQGGVVGLLDTHRVLVIQSE